MHPKPLDDELSQLVNERSPNRLSIDKRGSYSGHATDNGNLDDANKNDDTPNLIQLDADDPCQDDDIIFEDFVRARSKGGETEA
uniref:CSON001975 protein n=1 Tax=Culicoides sonorensis TaxID=179676 RepID=A0A336K5H4_CULSO